MLSLDQIKLLEAKVEKAISIIQKLTDERNALKIKLAEKNKRISELENMVVSFKDDQSKIEEGILNALDLLSAFEDSATTPEPKPRQEMTKKEKDLADIMGSQKDDEAQMDIF